MSIQIFFSCQKQSLISLLDYIALYWVGFYIGWPPVTSWKHVSFNALYLPSIFNSFHCWLHALFTVCNVRWLALNAIPFPVCVVCRSFPVIHDGPYLRDTYSSKGRVFVHVAFSPRMHCMQAICLTAHLRSLLTIRHCLKPTHTATVTHIHIHTYCHCFPGGTACSSCYVAELGARVSEWK